MSLHGDIRVNGRLLHQWEAQRVTNVDATPSPDDVSTYSCRVRSWVPGQMSTAVTDFTVEHRYGDGAAVLASKVLAVYAEEADRGLLVVSHPRCSCACHDGPGVAHFAPCCDRPPFRQEADR